jgi:hypothetical protein
MTPAREYTQMTNDDSRSAIDVLKQAPFDVLSKAYKERYAELRVQLGPHFTVKKIRECKGCGRPFSARNMRAHKCHISWKKR